MEFQTKKRGVKRKRKSFLNRARKFGSKVQVARGSQLDEDTFQYFVRVLEIVNSGFNSEEEKSIFVDNVFEQTVGEEINYSRNQLASNALESLLPFANDEVIRRFINAFDEDIRPICSDRFASHVLEKLITVGSEREMVEPNGERPWLVKVSLFLLNNIEDLIWDTYANHVMRTAVEQLGKLQKKQPELEYALKQYSHKMKKLQQIKDMACEVLPSALLQIFVNVLGPLAGPLLHRLLEEVFTADGEPDVIHPALTTEAGVRLAEAIVPVAHEYDQIVLYEMWNRLAKGRVVALATHPMANFFLQKLCIHCPTKVELKMIMGELSGKLSTVLAAGYTGVVLSLVQAFQRIEAYQNLLLKELLGCLECWEPKECRLQAAGCIASLTPLSRSVESPKRASLHGSLILQSLLNFKKPIQVVDSLLAIPAPELLSLLCSPCGSHVMDAFMSSQTVGEKNRCRMMHALQGQYVSLACSVHGSRALDALWGRMPVKLREQIASELCNSKDRMQRDKSGRHTWERFALDSFVHHRADWLKAQKGKDRVQSLFADIVKPAKG